MRCRTNSSDEFRSRLRSRVAQGIFVAALSRQKRRTPGRLSLLTFFGEAGQPLARLINDGTYGNVEYAAQIASLKAPYALNFKKPLKQFANQSSA
jgi:hypothetical protein